MAWVAIAAILLVVTLARPELGLNERRALSSLVPLYFMSFPLGHMGLEALIAFKVQLYVANEFVPDVLPEAVWLWTLLTVLGYAQWFVLPPLAARAVRRLGSLYSDGRAGAR